MCVLVQCEEEAHFGLNVSRSRMNAMGLALCEMNECRQLVCPFMFVYIRLYRKKKHINMEEKITVSST